MYLAYWQIRNKWRDKEVQATYCDFCGKKIRSDVTRKEMPVIYPGCAHWIESDMCDSCVEKIAKFCSELKREDNDE